MKGFKPTGFGPKAGFHFSAKDGFTGSTGNVTAVAPYVRRKAFADGGFVRQDTPRMKVDAIGDQGSALVRRKKSYAQWQDDVGAHSSLLPGFKDGGANWIAGATKNKGALHRALGVPEGKKIPAKKMAKAAHSDNPKMRKRAALAKTLGKMRKADGGKVEYEKPTYAEAFKDRLKEMLGMAAENSNGMAKRAADKISGREKQIDDMVDEAQTGKKNYSSGGKMKRMGYAKGGGVSRGEARKIAETTVGEHVRYPAPKGHKGLGSMMAKRR